MAEPESIRRRLPPLIALLLLGFVSCGAVFADPDPPPRPSSAPT